MRAKLGIVQPPSWCVSLFFRRGTIGTRERFANNLFVSKTGERDHDFFGLEVRMDGGTEKQLSVLLKTVDEGKGRDVVEVSEDVISVHFDGYDCQRKFGIRSCFFPALKKRGSLAVT